MVEVPVPEGVPEIVAVEVAKLRPLGRPEAVKLVVVVAEEVVAVTVYENDWPRVIVLVLSELEIPGTGQAAGAITLIKTESVTEFTPLVQSSLNTVEEDVVGYHG